MPGKIKNETAQRPALTVRAATWSARHPGRAIVGWLVFVALCLGGSALIGGKAPDNSDFWVGEAGRAEAIATDAGMMPPTVERILITAPDGRLDEAAAAAAARDVTRRLTGLPGVAGIAEPERSADGAALMVAVTMTGDSKEAKANVKALIEQTAVAQAIRPSLRIEETGSASNSVGVNKKLSAGLLHAEMITLPLTLVILCVVFGSILAAGVPLLLALSSIGAAMGLYTLASHVFPDAGGAVPNVILMIGMAVGIDYSLFYLKRAREERELSGGQLSHRTAVELAAATAGRAVLVSGLAVLVALAGLYVASDIVFSSIATGSIIVVLVSVVSSLTVLPALLTKLGRRTDRGRLLRRNRPTRDSGLWQAMLRTVMRRPVATLLTGTTAMVLLAVPAVGLSLKVEGNDTFSRAIPEMQAYDRLVEKFPAEGVAHFVAVRQDPARAGEVSAVLTELARRASRDPLFLPVAPRLNTSADRTVSTLELPIGFTGNSSEASDSLRRLRTDLVPATIGRLPGVTYAVSGGVARNADYVEHQSERLPWVVGFVLLLTFLMMLFAFGSVVIALIGILLNMLSAAAAFGALVAVFQNTWAENLLGFTSAGFIGAHLPLILFVILFGLSMDYQVFVVSRIKEAHERGLPAREAVVEGVTGSAGMVTSAAVVMMSVFVSFVFIDQLEMKQIGFGLAFAVLLDALIVRIMILPAALTLLGERAWWPAKRFRPRGDALTQVLPPFVAASGDPGR
jgi:RND superfamily putative drug exporter